MLDQLPSLRAFQPKFYTGSASRFHLPLFYDLVAVAKPRLVVVSGTGDGQIALTIAQAIREQRLDARCIALARDVANDAAWQTAREFGEEMFGSILEFREAGDGLKEIDLIVIDDCDDGAAVREELNRFRSQLSPNSISAIHGTNLERRDPPRAAVDVLPRDRVMFDAGIGLTIAADELPPPFSHDGLTALYGLVAARIDAQARADRAERDNSVLQARQLWIDSVLADRWKAQQIMDEQARDLEEKTRSFEELRRDRAKAQLVMDAQAEQMKHWTTVASDLQVQHDKLKAQVRELKATIKTAKAACRKRGRCFEPEKAKVRRSPAERIAREFARLRKRLTARQEAPKLPDYEPTPDRYQVWIREHEPDAAALQQQRREAREINGGPKFSLLIPVHNTPAKFLDELLASIAAQTYENWEACIVDAGSDSREAVESVEGWSAREPRFRIHRLPENRGISENTNTALTMATGDFIICVDHDDLVAPFALFEMAGAVLAFPHAEIFYSDEDRCTAVGKRHSPFFKPEWNPELLCSSMYIGHLTAYRRQLVEELGGFRKEFDLSQDYDLALRASERAREIRHIPHVLYHWREHAASGSAGGKPHARESNLAALRDAMHRRGLDADIIEYPTTNRARLKLKRTPRVSVIVPTDSAARAQSCAVDLLRATSYAEWEIIIVTNTALAETLESFPVERVPLRTVRYDKPFNFSDKCNAGAEIATGERLIFLNDDVEATQRDWIENVIEQLENPAVGAVSPKLLYATGKIQHAGLVTGVRGLVGTAFHQLPADSVDYFNLPQQLRDVSALSAACLAVRREDFARIGGFDAVNTPIAHSDLDLCFKLREIGLRCVYTPFATLRHVGHASIGEDERTNAPKLRERANVFLLKRWAGYTAYDPFFPPRMRDWLYHDSPTPIQMWGCNEPNPASTKPNLLFVSHDLSWSGAPLIVLQTARWCREQGYFVTVAAARGGPLAHEFDAARIPVVVDPLIAEGHESFTALASEFDCVIGSTIFSAPAIAAVAAKQIPHLWWIHEGRAAEHYLGTDIKLRNALRVARMIVTPDRRSALVYQPFSEREVHVLPYGIQDPARGLAPSVRRGDKPMFLLLGTVEQRKGQRVFLEALRSLPSEVTVAAEFRIVGRSHEEDITRDIRRAAEQFPFVTYSDGVPPDEALALINDSDVLISASFDETGPLIVMEALALGKAVVCTTVGCVSESLTNEQEALFFAPGDARALANATERLVLEPELLRRLQSTARAAYETHFTFDQFGRKFLALVEQASVTTSG